MDKPHKGFISNWKKKLYSPKQYPKLEELYGPTLRFSVVGCPGEYPREGSWIRTSLVVAQEGNEIETLNSRYTLVEGPVTEEGHGGESN